jgi:hypothetical protein
MSYNIQFVYHEYQSAYLAHNILEATRGCKTTLQSNFIWVGGRRRTSKKDTSNFDSHSAQKVKISPPLPIFLQACQMTVFGLTPKVFHPLFILVPRTYVRMYTDSYQSRI